MGEKRLDFSAPFLSVRRLSSTLAVSDGANGKRISQTPLRRQQSLPLLKPDCDLGQVTKTGAVPFLWEQIPGKAKAECEVHSDPLEEHSKTPRHPLGKILNINTNVSGERSGKSNVFKKQIEVSSQNEHALLLDSITETWNDAYSDGFGTLSPTGSFSLDQSVGGLSSYDGQEEQLSGEFSADPQTRDFMLSRFLPAAKALVLDMPQHTPRRQPVVTQQPMEVKEVVTEKRLSLFEQFESTILLHNNQYIDDVESEDGQEELDDSRNKLGKTCGVIPCLKDSAYHLNPVSGMNSQMQSPVSGMNSQMRSPVSSTAEDRRVARTSYSGPLFKHAYFAPQKKFHSGVLSIHEFEKKLMSKSKCASYSNDDYNTDVSSPCGRSREVGISPYRNRAPQSPFRDGATFLGLPKAVNANMFSKSKKEGNNLQDVSSCQPCKRSGPVSPIVEKTVYIDSVYNIPNTMSNSKPSLDDTLGSSSVDMFEAFAEIKSEAFATKSSVQDKRSINHLKERSTKELGDSRSSSSDASAPHKSCIFGKKAQSSRIGLKQDLDQKSMGLGYSKLNHSRSLNTTKTDEQGKHTALRPPIQKSPSESWLWRAIPSIHLRNPFSHTRHGSHLHSKKRNQKTSSADTKWKTIVRTSEIHRDHLRYSEELIPHISKLTF